MRPERDEARSEAGCHITVVVGGPGDLLVVDFGNLDAGLEAVVVLRHLGGEELLPLEEHVPQRGTWLAADRRPPSRGGLRGLVG